MTTKVKTIMTFINIILPKVNSSKYYETQNAQIQS
jgi:hypothetical protein